jgi:hypothetical protein
MPSSGADARSGRPQRPRRPQGAHRPRHHGLHHRPQGTRTPSSTTSSGSTRSTSRADGLRELALPGTGTRLQALGVILFAYLKLKLRLRAAGYDADFHPFDWRQSLVRVGQGAEGAHRPRGGAIGLARGPQHGRAGRALGAEQWRTVPAPHHARHPQLRLVRPGAGAARDLSRWSARWRSSTRSTRPRSWRATCSAASTG